MEQPIADLHNGLSFLVRALVDKPESTTVDVLFNDPEIVFKVTVNLGDLGKIIGKQGRTARAIRLLVSSVARKAGVQISVDIGTHHDTGNV